MDYSNRKWVIVNVSDITDEMIASAIHTSMDTLRKTNDGSKAILKYEGRKPSCFYNMETYSHEEILIELANSSWVSEE